MNPVTGVRHVILAKYVMLRVMIVSPHKTVEVVRHVIHVRFVMYLVLRVCK